MKKENVFFSVFVMILLMGSLVAAAGSSTGALRVPDAPKRATSAVSAEAAAACETHATTRERIRCRIEAKAEVNSIEESCRTLSADKRDACNEFQKRAGPCYDVAAREKSLCLRRHAGLGEGQLNRFADEDRRKYAALLLYELQERVELKQEQGALTADEAAELIDMIVEMKRLLLSNAPISDVREKMAAFKVEWRTAMAANV